MKLNYGFEYTEKDYENLTKATTSILGGLGTVLLKGIESITAIEHKKLDNKHEIKMKTMDHDILQGESELDELKRKLKEAEWEIKKMNLKHQKNVSILDPNPTDTDFDD